MARTSKLSSDKILVIAADYNSKSRTAKEMASDYGVNTFTIYKAIRSIGSNR